MSINLRYVEGTTKNLRCILKCHKVRSTFYTESTLRKLICKPKCRVATEDKNNSLFMKLYVVTAKHSTSVNLNGL